MMPPCRRQPGPLSSKTNRRGLSHCMTNNSESVWQPRNGRKSRRWSDSIAKPCWCEHRQLHCSSSAATTSRTRPRFTRWVNRVPMSRQSIPREVFCGWLAWYPRLLHGTAEERRHWRLIGQGAGIHWPELDEDLSIEGLILGRPSSESVQSLQRWLKSREVKRANGNNHLDEQ